MRNFTNLKFCSWTDDRNSFTPHWNDPFAADEELSGWNSRSHDLIPRADKLVDVQFLSARATSSARHFLSRIAGPRAPTFARLNFSSTTTVRNGIGVRMNSTSIHSASTAVASHIDGCMASCRQHDGVQLQPS